MYATCFKIRNLQINSDGKSHYYIHTTAEKPFIYTSPLSMKRVCDKNNVHHEHKI
jgi:hypothetical protein